MTNEDRLTGRSMVPELAAEVVRQIAAATPTPPTPAAYSETPADLAAALVNAGLMEPSA